MIKNCSVCGTPFEPLKTHGEYCGKPCRDKAYRQRKGAERPSLARPSAEGAPLPDDDREALRELYRAAIARIIADGLVVPGRRGEADVAHPLARFVGQWFAALDKGESPADSGDDVDALISSLLGDAGGRIETR
ncbi:hypothetical protein [Streptomyces sp. NPDC056405]|uniref:hypothetical protein n=1 Tax=Streptomyces sp. NPDC056405 TaxID=3345811 RepID=UPI0035DC1B22